MVRAPPSAGSVTRLRGAAVGPFSVGAAADFVGVMSGEVWWTAESLGRSVMHVSGS